MFLPIAHFQYPKIKPIVDPGFPLNGANGEIYSIIKYENTIFIAGNFTSIGGVNRNGLAALDSNTGAILPLFQGQSGVVGISSMILVNNMLLLGGSFTSVNGVNRNGIAALNAITGELLTPYLNQFGGSLTKPNVMSFASKNNKLYLAGQFTNLNNEQRLSIACIDPSSMQLLSYYPQNGLGNDSSFIQRGFFHDNDTWWIYGSFQNVGGVACNNLAKLNL